MEAPQIILLFFLALGGIIAAINHGKPRENYNFYYWLMSVSVVIALLAWGGFFH